SALSHLILPTIVLALGGIAGWSRYLRASMLETINSDYIRTARAKGLKARRIWFNHGLRNALIPMATFIGPTIVGLLSGTVIIETIFAWPGIGRLYFQALGSRDYPLIMASVVIGAVLTIIGYLISDILYAVFDPRIRL
ncbi:MAG: ABC transporter permease, partial [Anaerolineae bacterium]|nr:ABC transporter permease [Anaerolineae bacterium]